MIMDDQGSQLYSNCFGGFCQSFFKTDRQKLEGFLNLLTKAPQLFGLDNSDDLKYNMNDVDIYIHKVEGNCFLCVGLTKGTLTEEEIEALNNSLSTAIQHIGISKLQDSESTFTKMVVEILHHVPHLRGEVCSNDKCPLKISNKNQTTIWDDLREKYNMRMEMKKE